ncbi:TIR domain-containing protein [Caballeronia sp. DA-9]|uniref:TIR domain-containing protein n=1 Tax=Caballeronia sp. DA-9 TaxID=3436237 RepID=UPI003F675A35
MKERFEGPTRRNQLVAALAQQRICHGISGLPERLADVCELVEFDNGDKFITQGDQTNDVYLLLSGTTKILVGRREVAVVESGTHVGEMAAIEALPRSATVAADGVVVAARLSESSFLQLANEFPLMYKEIAIELVRRLERRNKALARADEKASVFAISSVEALPVANTGVLAFDHNPKVQFWCWPDDVFGPGNYPLEDLEAHLEKADFAIAIAQADDVTTSRKESKSSPRDNVVFELGLFMGKLGRRRTILMKPKGVDMKLPSDLIGVTTIDYPAKLSDTPSRDMRASWEKVRQHIEKVHG